MGKYTKSLAFPILAVILLGTIPWICSGSSEEYYMLTLINKERQANGLNPLSMNSALSSASRLHSQDMINRGFFNHINPDGLTPSDRAKNAGYNFIILAENICGNPSIDAGHLSLMGSPSHRSNILNPSYKEVGIGIVDGGPYGKMITQMFGTQPENNITTATQPEEDQGKPDITIKKVDFSGQVEPLKPVLLAITLTNSGKKNASNFVFAVFNGPPEKGNQLGKINIASLYVGQSITANLNWTIPTEGSYTLYFIADYNNNIDEENENNNTSTYSISLNSTNPENTSEEKSVNTINSTSNNKPDLYVSKNDLSSNQIVYEGTSSLFSFRIRNIGKSAGFQVPIKVYVNGNLQSSSMINQLLPSSYTDLVLYLTFTGSDQNSVEINVDPDNVIDEISESNNSLNFNVKVVSRENNSFMGQNNPQKSEDIDLLIYPYYITIEEQEDEFLSISAKIKNKSSVVVNDFSVTFYEKDNNSSNNIFLKKIFISLGPEEIVEEKIEFIPSKENVEIIVVIDEENKIKDVDKNNNTATKIFSNIIGGSKSVVINEDKILNTTPKEANISKLLKVTMKLKDINASNAYLYYKHNDVNDSFYILKMTNDGNYSYSVDVDPLESNKLYYYFEVDTGVEILKSPSDTSEKLYTIDIIYETNVQGKKNPSFLDNIRKIFGLK